VSKEPPPVVRLPAGPAQHASRAGFWRRLGLDLRHGRNVELYLTVVVSVVLAILGVFDVVDAPVLGAATLAVLALLAASLLTSRTQVEMVKSSLDEFSDSVRGDVSADQFLLDRVPPLDEILAAAMDIRLVGVTLTRTVRELMPELDRSLRRGSSVRVIVFDVESPAAVEAVARTRGATGSDFYRNRLSSTFDLLSILTTSATDISRLQLRVVPFVPTFGMYLLDPNENHGRIWVEVYQHRTLEANPTMSLRSNRDGHWYQLFLRQFETLWESGRELPLPIHSVASGAAPPSV